ncbi:NosD domain-containing protein [Haloarchaeobius iranensis]|uniref:Nitrous oxidase accessory protein NosD, contains tandem CASH domains n=1 Tax=Haloarchaeobius iranensis TaxID=996166 RepID=A0A1G9YPF2_9EURY|nr:NosD domain-containing protein [Haloarchaeobius iranensis]SDN10326.1 Nitrous oxidase accessory protein NosD, contains tandem CASH domains [Haloarchaeobius iranensis]
MRTVTLAGAVVLLALLVAGSGLVVDTGDGEQLSPVAFDRTLTTGLTGVDVEQAREAGYVVPRGQVFYSQYEYVVGYYGTDALVTGVSHPRHRAQFGRPLAVFVNDLAGTDPALTDEGYVTLPDAAAPGWTRAEDAWFVVGTPARTPAGPTALPFGDRAAARAFAAAHDGSVVDWEGLRERRADRTDAVDHEPPVAERQRWADRTVERAHGTLDRPVSMVVGTDRPAVETAAGRVSPEDAAGDAPAAVVLGEDAPTLAAAVDRAPANTTVRLLAGRYDANLSVGRPLTLAGTGTDTVLDGGGDGTVVTVSSPAVALTDLRIVGVGDANAGQLESDDGSAWDRRIRLTYGYGDAAVRLHDADRSLVENVRIDTPSNGVVALDSDGVVVRETQVTGTDGLSGFMSVLPMYSRMVVEDSRFDGGRDAVYAHYADGTVVRDNHVEDLRFGFHDMYTSDTLVVNNTVRDVNTGIYVMTRPAGNAVVGNDVRNSSVGISTAGTASYVTGNVVANNEVGLSIGTARSTYRGNTVVDNGVGVRSTTMLPTNDVFENDVVGNDRPVSPGTATLESWAVDGRGNYWGAVPGVDRDGDGVVERAYRPTDPVDRNARRSPVANALAYSPAARMFDQFQQAAPGLRRPSVVDPAPLTDPVHPNRLETHNVSVS